MIARIKNGKRRMGYVNLFLMKWCKIILISIGIFLLPIKPLILSIGAFVVMDTILGIIRAKKKNIRITSRRFNQIWIKTIIYQGVIITTYFIDSAMLNEISLIFSNVQYLTTKLVCLGVITNEVASMDESLKDLGIDIWARLKDFFKLAKKVRSHVGDLKDDE